MIDDFKPASKPVKKAVTVVPVEESKAVEPEPIIEAPEITSDTEGSIPAVTEKSKTSSVKKKRLRWPKLSKKQWLLVVLILLIVLAGVGFGAYKVLHKKPVAKPVVKTAAKVEPPKTTEPSTLTGLTVPLATNKLPVTGVMIENSPDARPQSGLNAAGVVFEAVAEGGITRFLALFQDDATPDYLGPVRSVRPYYLDYLQGFDAAVAHVGGSPDGLAKIKSDGVKDLDQFFNAGAYKRISSRYAPHNVYTSISNLVGLQKGKGFSSTYNGFPRKKEKPATTPTAKTIDFAISSFEYNAHYVYDTPSNSYKRSEGGKPHTDEKSAAQLSPKVVIAIVVPKGIAADGQHTTYQNIGNGKTYVFQDGNVTEGTWTKTDAKTQIKFTDSTGASIALNPGQTWISLVGEPTDVSYKP